MRISCGKWHLCGLLLGTTLWFASAIPAAGDALYGPRFEVGGGAELLRESSPPEWAAESAYRGMGVLSMRVFRGLSVQAGMDFGGAGNPKADSISLDGTMVTLNEKSFSNTSWAGIRYEIPLNRFRENPLRMHSVYGGAGMCWAKYGVSSNEEDSEAGTVTTNYDVAELTGTYLLAGARWRIDDPEQAGSWLGAYGVDIGAKYVRFDDTTLKYSGIAAPSGDFSSMQIFAVVFVKFSLAD